MGGFGGDVLMGVESAKQLKSDHTTEKAKEAKFAYRCLLYLLPSSFCQGRSSTLCWSLSAAVAPPIVPAFLSIEQYKILCENHTPFLCPSCYREQHEAEVKELKGTVETLKVVLS